jgi:nucleotide-binding universal stress UspA family protein
MNTTVLLAVDVAAGSPLRHVQSAVDAASRLVRDDSDRVIVLNVREFSITKLTRTMTDRGGLLGSLAVRDAVTELRATGVHAAGLVREADCGHVAETIIKVAREHDASLIVLGARGHTTLPRIPMIDVATHLLHLSTLPVLIVPPADETGGATVQQRTWA